MPNLLFIPLIFGFTILVAASVCVVMARRLNTAIRIVAALAFAPVALFCMFGFAASMEPGDNHVVWRVVYLVVFLACLLAIGRLVLAKPLKGTINQE